MGKAQTRIRLALPIVLCLPAVAASNRNALEDWVLDNGGSVTKDGSGSVTGVSLRGAWLRDSDVARLVGFPGIRRLDISRTHINDRALEAIPLLTNLEELNLAYSEHITDAGLARIRGVRNLRKLDLEGAKITDSGMSSLAALTTLRSISLKATQVTDSGLEQLEPLTEIEELKIGGNRIAGFGLLFLQALPKLKSLDLSGVQLTDDGIWSVALTDLNIDSLTALKSLEALNLGAAELSATAVIPDGGIRETANLRVTDLGLAKLAGLRQLRSLDLTRAEVSAGGLQTLLKFPKLERLVLAYAPAMDDSAAPTLAKLKLRTLDLTGTKVSAEGAASLRRELPMCRVITSLTTGGLH